MRSIRPIKQTFINYDQLKYQFQQIASIVQGEIFSMPDDTEIRDLLLDSRKVVFPETSLFFALIGTRRTGHQFIAEAYRKGVRNFIISERDAIPEGGNVIIVKDTLAALQQLAAFHRRQFVIPVIGITGSNGKTIVKEWLNQLLESRYRIVRSPRSYNSQIGVPLSVWQLSENFDLAIFEAGISHTGEMERLQEIIQPRIGIFTNAGDAHAGGFTDLRQKIMEKLILFKEAETLIYCKDYPELDQEIFALNTRLNLNNRKPLEIISWSVKSAAELSIQSITKTDRQTLIAGSFRNDLVQTIIPFTDDASIENAINCWCLLLLLNIDSSLVSEKMMDLHQVAMRLELRDGINNSSIINDSYSADLSSLKIALDFLSQQHQHTKRTVILTDFLESGRNEEDLYASISLSLRRFGINRLIGIGPAMMRNQSVFLQNPAMEALFFDNVEVFKTELGRVQFGNETILLKGARIFGLEQINQVLEEQSHQTVLEIDLGALLHNLRAYQQLLKPATRLMAMVKAFSYGSGSYEVASALQFNKVDYLAVAYTDEGVELRKGGIGLPVMVMNPDVSSFNTLVAYNLEPEIYSIGLLKALEAFLKKEGINQFPIHIELETGMNRLGFSRSELPVLLETLQSGIFKIQSVFSHLVGSEDPLLDEFTRQQAELFTELSQEIQARVNYPLIRHLLNTSGIARHPSLQFDMVRIGIGLYGIYGGQGMDLRQVSTLRSTIAQVKNLKQGETVSYGRSGVINRDSRIATVRIGYADGYSRRLSNGKGSMWVKGSLAPVVGQVCMDMTMIDITDIPNAREGDEVVIFGKQLPAEQVALAAGTIPYDILTGVSQRVKRVYFHE